MPALMRQPRARLPEATSHRCGLAMPAPCRAPLIWDNKNNFPPICSLKHTISRHNIDAQITETTNRITIYIRLLYSFLLKIFNLLFTDILWKNIMFIISVIYVWQNRVSFRTIFKILKNALQWNQVSCYTVKLHQKS